MICRRLPPSPNNVKCMTILYTPCTMAQSTRLRRYDPDNILAGCEGVRIPVRSCGRHRLDGYSGIVHRSLHAGTKHRVCVEATSETGDILFGLRYW